MGSTEVAQEVERYHMMEGKQHCCVREDQQVVPAVVAGTQVHQVVDSHLLL